MEEIAMEDNAEREARPATFKQKNYIRSLCQQNGRQMDCSEIETLTVSEASKLIDSLKGGGEEASSLALPSF